MQEVATILEKNGSSVKIKLTAGENCKSCHLCDKYSDEKMIMTLKTDLAVEKGDNVVVRVEGRAFISFSFFLYIMPLLLAIASYAVFAFGLKSEGAGILSFLVIFILSFLLSLSKLKKREKEISAKIIRKAYDEDFCD